MSNNLNLKPSNAYFKKKQNRNSQCFSKLTIAILYACVILLLLSTFPSLAHSAPISESKSTFAEQNPANPQFSVTCKKDVPIDWSYLAATTLHEPFTKLGLICEIFGYFCDENSKDLTSIEKSIVKIYNEEGVNGNYFDVVQKMIPNFLKDFCGMRKYEEVYDETSPRICMSSLRVIYQNKLDLCTKDAQPNLQKEVGNKYSQREKKFLEINVGKAKKTKEEETKERENVFKWG